MQGWGTKVQSELHEDEQMVQKSDLQVVRMQKSGLVKVFLK